MTDESRVEVLLLIVGGAITCALIVGAILLVRYEMKKANRNNRP